jgi:hypothetical protein
MYYMDFFNPPKNGTPTDTNEHQRTSKAEKITHHLTSCDIISHWDEQLVAPPSQRRAPASSRCVPRKAEQSFPSPSGERVNPEPGTFTTFHVAALGPVTHYAPRTTHHEKITFQIP